jgi:two-component system nitrogen regulation response regulator GlnG
MLEAAAMCETGCSMQPEDDRVTVLPADREQDLSECVLDADPYFTPSSIRIGDLLVIGDALRPMAQQLCRDFPALTLRIQVVGSGLAGLEHIRRQPPNVILLDLGLPDQSGLEVHQQIRQIDAGIPVIFVTPARKADTVIEAMKDGAFDCLVQPLSLTVLHRVVGEAFDVARWTRRSPAAEESVPSPEAEYAVIGSCPAMGEVYKAIGRVAAQDVPVLITGESGTGKDLVARAIYQHSRRAGMPFLALNCAAIPENLLESELFGHEKGAFTGADRRRIGKFEQCHGGTIFLDEIGDMPVALQAKMLRLLQEQSFERVGGNETVRTDVRLIAATHHDLRADAAQGKFRPDLYYRLGIFTIHLPPLRERGSDLPLLVRHYLRRLSRELGREVIDVAPEALACLHRYSWPGNVRELQSILKQALLRASGSVLLPAFLPELSGNLPEPGTSPASTGDGATPTGDLGLESFIQQRLNPKSRDLYLEAHRQVDQFLLPKILQYTGGNQQQAARLLGIARQTLRQKLRDQGLYVAPSLKENPLYA